MIGSFVCCFGAVFKTGFHCVALAVQELCRPGWLGTLTDRPASASQTLEKQTKTKKNQPNNNKSLEQNKITVTDILECLKKQLLRVLFVYNG